MALPQVPQDEEGQHGHGQELRLVGQQQRGRDGDADAAGDDEELCPRCHRARSLSRGCRGWPGWRRWPRCSRPGSTGRRRGPRRPWRNRPSAWSPWSRTKTRAPIPAEVTTWPTLKTDLTRGRRFTACATTATTAKTSTVMAAGTSRTSRTKKPSSRSNGVGLVVDVEHDRPDPAGGHQRAEDRRRTSSRSPPASPWTRDGVRRRPGSPSPRSPTPRRRPSLTSGGPRSHPS